MGFGARVVASIFLCITVASLFSSSPAAASGSWTTGTFSWGEREGIPNNTREQGCYSTTATIVGVSVLPEIATVCVYQRPDFRYAVYHKQFPNWWGGSYTSSYFVVSLGTDRQFYYVENMGTRLPLEVPSSNDLHFNTLTMGFTNNHLLTYIPDFHTKLTRVSDVAQPVKYLLQPDTTQNFIPSIDGSPVTTGAVGVSNNGRWMVVEIMGAGIVRVDTTTRQMKAFSDYVHGYGFGSNANMTYLITDDGSLVAMFDYNITPTIHTLTDNCGLDISMYTGELRDQLRGNSCPSDDGRLESAISAYYTNYYEARAARATNFNADGDTLYFVSYEYDDPADPMSPSVYRTPLMAAEFEPETRIEYLAIGDSFTSGEGDIEKKPDGSSYYVPGTENLNECHLSSRSYPFLLRDHYGISSERMQSVACSGAQVLPDYVGNSQNYLGQSNRVSGKSGDELDAARQAALELFTPGIIPQLEYVKRYQPTTLTVMGGGNDVGFGSILEYCASPTWQELFVDATCGYAKEGHALQAVLAQSIQSQYNYTLMLLRMIREYSPETSVYVVGYPSFISESPIADCLNSGVLDEDERMMIHTGVTTMNAMLAAAAESSGVSYIDIQDSLNGGRLCEGSEYVTGVGDLGVEKLINNDTRESFHPNASGHMKIASRIISSDFSLDDGLNSQPLSEQIAFNALDPFAVTDSRAAMKRAVAEPIVTEQTTLEVSLPAGSTAISSNVTLTMYSNPVELGKLLSNNDGSVADTVLLPATLKPGRHVLLAEATSPSGEAVIYYQFITVISNQLGDADADGVLDANDPCLFISSWIDETTEEDACVATVSVPDEQQEEAPDVPESVTPENEDKQTGRRENFPARNAATIRPTERNDESDEKVYTQVITSSNDETGIDEALPQNEVAQGRVKGVSTEQLQTPISLVRWQIYAFASFAILSTIIGGYGILKSLRSQA